MQTFLTKKPSVIRWEGREWSHSFATLTAVNPSSIQDLADGISKFPCVRFKISRVRSLNGATVSCNVCKLIEPSWRAVPQVSWVRKVSKHYKYIVPCSEHGHSFSVPVSFNLLWFSLLVPLTAYATLWKGICSQPYATWKGKQHPL